MAITSTDLFGTFTDTGIGTLPTPRLNTQVETHAVTEVDTGSKIFPRDLPKSHSTQRPEKSSPR